MADSTPEDNNSVTQGGDTVMDLSSHTEVVNTGAGDVDFDASGDTNVASADGAAAVSGVGNQTQTGGGFQIGGDLDGDIIDGDGNVTGSDNVMGEGHVAGNAGDVIMDNQGPVVSGSADGAIIGEDNSALNAGGNVGAAGFGSGEVSNIEAGGGSTVGNDNMGFDNVNGNINVDGEQNNVADSILDGTALGGDAIDSSVAMDASGGGSIAYGENSDSSADNSSDFSMHDSGNTDMSTHDSFNSEAADHSIHGSYNNEESSITDSFGTVDESSYNSTLESFEATDSFGTYDDSITDSWNSDFSAADSFDTTDQSTFDGSTEIGGDAIDM